jgi:hypothetical protein
LRVALQTGGTVVDQKDDALEDCKETVAALKVENEELRESAESFGALAERLNQANRADGNAAPIRCPRCGTAEHVQRTAQVVRGNDLHCAYCGNSWRSVFS